MLRKKTQSVQTMETQFNKRLGSAGTMQGTAGLCWGSAGLGVPWPRSRCPCQGAGSSRTRVSASHRGQTRPAKTLLLPTRLSPCFKHPPAETTALLARLCCHHQPRAEPPSEPIAQRPTLQKRVVSHPGQLCRGDRVGRAPAGMAPDSRRCSCYKPCAAVAGVSALERQL